MIKNTFYNLPEEKRQRITDAIFNEFAGSSGERVSINNIIKNANISRGSFYQYFDDKVDLVEVMTRSFINFSLEKATEVISRTHGDIFVTYDLLFEILCECSKDTKQSIIMKNLIKNIKANDSLVSEYFINRFKGVAELVSVTNNFDRSNLKYTSDEDVKCLSQESLLTRFTGSITENLKLSKQVQLQIKFNIHATGCCRFQQKM